MATKVRLIFDPGVYAISLQRQEVATVLNTLNLDNAGDPCRRSSISLAGLRKRSEIGSN